ncbi:type II secretion system protein E [bacterium BMS3Abin07]|nr:type II secretion system protein E [bacterium BMS3Abin07]GBE31762.1 type II secretion system protein E [bacterium BMS3Bbin05]HDL20079.1 type II/IV secretion system protein [Nitrospirota bacterium]HDO23498.1 type II/IV secretion system protein [Nitrospirota bacterium]
MAAPKRIGQILKERGLLTEQEINLSIEQQKITGDLLGETFIKLGFVSAPEMAKALSEQAGMPYLNLHEYTISEDALKLVPKDVAERVGFMPIDLKEGRLTIGLVNPSNVLAVDTATRLTKKPPETYVIDSDAFYDLIDRAYYFLENPIQLRLKNSVDKIKASENITADSISDMARLIIMDGIRRNATDIHITPEKQTVHVFYRIDGVLQHGFCFPKAARSGVISKIKIMSELDIAEQRLPQDGSFSFPFLNKSYDMRVATIPTIYGENLALRILGNAGPLLRLSSLGFNDTDTLKMQAIFKKPYGIILITGPTGSGKTTTLYAALRDINLLEKNVLTVEDPVEYRLSLVKQTEVNPKAGYDFALAGRNFMRQDPDVILLGEIRDEETARIAIRASITGHLVLTTLHTNDAITAIPRLLDFGIDSFMLSSSLLAISSQRLVRKICPFCKTEYKLPDDIKLRLELSGVAGHIDTAHRGAGCAACNLTGYSGRTAIGEIMVIDDEIRDHISSSASLKTIKELAVGNGMRFLMEDGMNKVKDGITSIDEVLRVVG